jgi:type IV pilus biogenesis protein CpaD/CtpE
MRTRLIAALAILVIGLAGCSATPEPTPTVTVTVTATPEPAPTVTVTAEPPAAVAPSDDRLAALRTVSAMVTGVEETEPGRWVIHTSILDPRGDDGSSAEAQKAIAICEKAVELGATYVSVMESNDSTFVLYGHPSYGDTCTVA